MIAEQRTSGRRPSDQAAYTLRAAQMGLLERVTLQTAIQSVIPSIRELGGSTFNQQERSVDLSIPSQIFSK